MFRAIAQRWTIGRALSSGQRRLAGGDPVGALESFDRGLSVDPEAAPLLWHRSLALVEADRGEEAVAEIDRAVSRADESFVAHLLRGRILVTIGRPADAAVSLDRALELDPENRVARGWRAVAHLALDEIEAGLSLLEGRGLTENPEVLAHLLLEMERLDADGAPSESSS